MKPQPSLELAPKLRIPVDFVTQTCNILGKRGSGKTTTAVILIEELLKARQQVIVIDPLDVVWGLKSSKDGGAEGFPITVLGGDHGDLPLEAAAGATIAEFLVEHPVPTVLSLRHFSMTDQRRFVTDFCERLYHLKGKTGNRRPVHIIIDEADEFAPQKLQPGQQRMFGAIDRLVRRGRSAGIGVTLISQRAAVVNKDVLSQAELLICHQTISPQDRAALQAWIQAHDAHGQAGEFMGSLASLGRGEAWVWSPGWLDIFQRVQVRDRTTFDSSATPKAGAAPATPAKVAAIDLEALRGRLAESIERAKAEDPRALQKALREAQAEIAKLRGAAPAADPAEIHKAVNAAVSQARQETFHNLLATIRTKVLSDVEATVRKFSEQCTEAADQMLAGILGHLQEIGPLGPQPVVTETVVRGLKLPVPKKTSPPPPIPAAGGNRKLAAGEIKILTVLAQNGAVCSKKKVALIAGYAAKGGGFNNYLSSLRTLGYLEGSGELAITGAGREALGHYTPLPTGHALLEHWASQLGRAESTILRTLAQIGNLGKEALAEACGYEARGGGFNNALSKLRTLELIEGRHDIRLSQELR